MPSPCPYLTLSCLIAAIGVVADSTVTAVGAMVLRPEFGPLSFVIALLAGAASMLSLVWSKSSALIGVFISVRTVPAAGFAFAAAAVGDLGVAAQTAI